MRERCAIVDCGMGREGKKGEERGDEVSLSSTQPWEHEQTEANVRLGSLEHISSRDVLLVHVVVDIVGSEPIVAE